MGNYYFNVQAKKRQQQQEHVAVGYRRILNFEVSRDQLRQIPERQQKYSLLIFVPQKVLAARTGHHKATPLRQVENPTILPCLALPAFSPQAEEDASYHMLNVLRACYADCVLCVVAPFWRQSTDNGQPKKHQYVYNTAVVRKLLLRSINRAYTYFSSMCFSSFSTERLDRAFLVTADY